MTAMTRVAGGVLMLAGLLFADAASAVDGTPFDLAGFRQRAASDRAAGIAEGRAALDAGVFEDDPQGERTLLWYMGGAAIGIPDDVALDEVVLRLRSLGEQGGDAVAGSYAGFLRGSRQIDLGQVGTGLAEVLRAANVLNVHADKRQRAIAATELCRAYVSAGRPWQALDHCRRHTALVEADGDAIALARARYLEASVLSNVGERAQAIELWRQSHEGFLHAGLDTLAGRAAGSLAGDLVLEERFDEALARAREALAAAEGAGNPISINIARGIVAEALAGQGDLPAALAEVEQAIAGMEDIEHPMMLSRLLRTQVAIRRSMGVPAEDLAAVMARVDELESIAPNELEYSEIVSLEERYTQREQALRIRELEHENRLRQHELERAADEAERQQAQLREQRRFGLMATIAVVALALMLLALVLLLRAQRRLARSFREQAYRDALTSLPNRRAILERIAALLRDPDAAGQGHALIMIDLDHFKAINDIGGHPFGDAVLADVGRCLLRLVPDEGMVARLGGEEFLMLCPRTGVDAALAIAGRIRTGVHALARQVDGQRVAVTVSQGIALFDGVDSRDVSGWLNRADHAAYQAKANGRDRIEVAGNAAPPS